MAGWYPSPAGKCRCNTRASSRSTAPYALRPGSSTSRTWARSSSRASTPRQWSTTWSPATPRACKTGRRSTPALATSEGTILDDLIVYRHARDAFLIVCNAGNRDKISAHFRKAAENHCEFDDRSDEVALLRSAGADGLRRSSRSRAKTPRRCAELKSFQFRDAVVANVQAHRRAHRLHRRRRRRDLLRVERRGARSGARCSSSARRSGIEPVGLGARDTLRLEARLSLYGNDIDETTNPLEAGLGWIVKLDKPMFVGKDALASSRRGPARKLVGFEMTGRGIARHGYPLLDADGNDGRASARAAAPSPTLGKSIGLGYLPLGARGGRHELPGRLPRQGDRGRGGKDSVLQAQPRSSMSDKFEYPAKTANTPRTTSGRSPSADGVSGRHHRLRGRSARRHHAGEPRREGRRRSRRGQGLRHHRDRSRR